MISYRLILYGPESRESALLGSRIGVDGGNRSPYSLGMGRVPASSQDAQSQEQQLAADIPKSPFAGTMLCFGAMLKVSCGSLRSNTRGRR